MWFHKCPELVTPEPEVTREHVAALHTHIDEVWKSIGGHLQQVRVLPDDLVDHLFRLTAAVRAYEASHRSRTEHTVNGFTQTQETVCQCDLCQKARAALQ